MLRMTILCMLVMPIASFSAHWIGVETGQPVLMWEYETGYSNATMLWDGQNIFRLPNEAMRNLRRSPDGRWAWVAYRDGQNRVFVWDGWRVIVVSKSETYNTNLVWSNDSLLAWAAELDTGSYNIASPYKVIYVWDGKQSIVVSSPNSFASQPAWSHDGRLAWEAYVDNPSKSDIIVWDGQTMINVTQSEADDRLPQWSPDGQLAWSTMLDVRRTVIRWDGTHTFDMMPVDIQYGNSPSWSLENQLAWSAFLASTYDDIYRWTGYQTSAVSSSPLSEDNPEWSPDGRLAWSARDEINGNFAAITVWDGTRETYIYRTTEGYLYNLAWSP